MAVAVQPNQSKPWEKEQIPFNIWYRKRLQGDFGRVLTLVDVTRDVIKNGGNKDEMYQTFVANLQEAQARLTQLLFELEEADMELALKINDAICSTLDWAKKSEVSSLLPEIPSTKEVTALVGGMLGEEKPSIVSTDEKKVEDLIAIELQVGVGASAITRMVNLPRGSTLMDLTNVISNLKKRKQITWVRQGLKVEEHTVLLNGDSIIAVLAKVEGPFEGFDEPDQKTEPQAELPVAIAPLAPPPQEKKQIAEAPVEDLLTNAPPEKVVEAHPFDFLNTEPKETSEKNDVVDVDIEIEPSVEEKRPSNPFDPLAEQPEPVSNANPFEEFEKQPKPDSNANPFEEFENEEEEPLISFGRFSIGDDGEASKEVKVVKEATEKDKLLGEQDDNAELNKQDSFPKFAGFS